MNLHFCFYCSEVLKIYVTNIVPPGVLINNFIFYKFIIARETNNKIQIAGYKVSK